MLGGYTPSRIMGVISQGAQHLLLEGSTLYYGPNSSGGFTLSLAPADGQSGLAAVGFPALFGQDAALLSAAPYQVSYGLDPGLDMSGYYTLSATDRVGNEALSPQFRLVKDSTAPTAEVYVPAQPALAFRVNWQGQDSQAGVDYYDLQYREKEAQDWGDWLDWQTGTQETSARFVGQAGHEYQFRVRAADRVGNLGEWVTGSLAAVQNVTIYYYAGSVRVAMRQGERVTYLLADHLGSTQVTADEQGSELGRYLYTAWGETRQVSGESATDRLYTGQRQEAEIGLYYYNARWYDPALGRFTQADTIVPEPGNVLDWDRYAYVKNNPIKYTDPSGHREIIDEDEKGNIKVQKWLYIPFPIPDWEEFNGNAIEFMVRALLSEEGVKIGTEREDDVFGVAWAIRNRATERYGLDPYSDEVKNRAWMHAATSQIHGMNTNLAHDPLNYWFQWGIFETKYEMIIAYNRAREIAIEIINASKYEDITKGALRWSDAWCIGGQCEYNDLNQAINTRSWNRTHFSNTENTYQKSWCVTTVSIEDCN